MNFPNYYFSVYIIIPWASSLDIPFLHCTSRTVVLTPNQSEVKWMANFSNKQVEWGSGFFSFNFCSHSLLACFWGRRFSVVRKIGCLNKSMNFLLHVVTVSSLLSTPCLSQPLVGNLNGTVELKFYSIINMKMQKKNFKGTKVNFMCYLYSYFKLNYRTYRSN